MPGWADLFDNHGVKIVTRTDKAKSAYVTTVAQRRAMKAAGLQPSFGESKAVHTIEVLFDSSLRSMQISYYNSERRGSGRGPEPRIGQGLPSWINEGDRIVIGNIGRRIFVAKEPMPPLGQLFLTTSDGDYLTTARGERLTVPAESEIDQLSRDIQAGRPILLGSPIELQRRREISARIAELQDELSQLTPNHGGFGHNNPPKSEQIESRGSEVLAMVVETTAALSAELERKEPDALKVASAGSLLRNIGQWMSGKGDVFAEEFVKSFGKSLGDSVGKSIGSSVKIAAVATAVKYWLDAITWPF